jgi:hypothetical protein
MDRRTDTKLVVAVLSPPIVALGAQWLSYSLVHQGCIHGSKAILYATKLAGIAACAACFFVARAVHSELPAAETISAQRARFLAIGGEVFGVFFLVVILAMAIPDFLLRVCD